MYQRHLAGPPAGADSLTDVSLTRQTLVGQSRVRRGHRPCLAEITNNSAKPLREVCPDAMQLRSLGYASVLFTAKQRVDI